MVWGDRRLANGGTRLASDERRQRRSIEPMAREQGFSQQLHLEKVRGELRARGGGGGARGRGDWTPEREALAAQRFEERFAGHCAGGPVKGAPSKHLRKPPSGDVQRASGPASLLVP